MIEIESLSADSNIPCLIKGSREELQGFLNYLKVINIEYLPGGFFNSLIPLMLEGEGWMWIDETIEKGFLWLDKELLQYVYSYQELDK